jgi:hypothetical protein
MEKREFLSAQISFQRQSINQIRTSIKCFLPLKISVTYSHNFNYFNLSQPNFGIHSGLLQMIPIKVPRSTRPPWTISAITMDPDPDSTNPDQPHYLKNRLLPRLIPSNLTSTRLTKRSTGKVVSVYFQGCLLSCWCRIQCSGTVMFWYENGPSDPYTGLRNGSGSGSRSGSCYLSSVVL